MGTPSLSAGIAAIVLLLLLTASTADDQYSARNRYRSGPEAPGPRFHDVEESAYELNFVPISNDEKSYVIEPRAELRRLDDARLKTNITNGEQQKQADELQIGCEGNPLRKRSEDDAVPLKELLKQWGIDTTTRARRGDIEVIEAPRPGGDVPGAHNKRDTSVGRKLLWAKSDDRMWGFAEDDGMQTSEDIDDGRQHLKNSGHHHHRKHFEDEETRRRRIDEARRRQWEEQERKRLEDERRRAEEEARRATSMPRRDPHEERRKVDEDRWRTTPMPRQDPYEERRRIEEERRRAEEERRRIEEERRRITPAPQSNSYEERRRAEEERRRIEEERRRATPAPQSNSYEERRRAEEERRRIEEERRRIDEERRRTTPAPQPNSYEERRRAEEERRRNEGRKTAMPQRDPYEERRRMEEARRRQMEEERRRTSATPEQDPRELRRRPEDDRRRPEENRRRAEDERRRPEEERRRNDGDTYEERMRKWQQMKEEHDRMVRERENRRRHPETRPEESNRNKSQEDLERERKLQDYIRRNTPIVVSRNRSQPPSNLYDDNSRRVASNTTQRRPGHEDNYQRRDNDRIRENEAIRRAELQRRHDEERRRKLVEEESRKIMEERKRMHEAHKGQRRPILPNDYQRTIAPETRNRQTPRWWERKEDASSSSSSNSASSSSSSSSSSTMTPVEDTGEVAGRRKGPGSTRGWDDEANRRRYHEFKRTEDSVTLRPTTTAIANPVDEDQLRRLKGLPVNARIIVRPIAIDDDDDDDVNDNGNNNTEATPSPLLSPRFGVEDDIDFPGLGPLRKGPEVPKFPVPPTEHPPAESPPSCIWAIVVCCKEPTKRDATRLGRCLEATGCPGAKWDSSICSAGKVRSANSEIMRFYLAGQKRSNKPKVMNFEY